MNFDFKMRNNKWSFFTFVYKSFSEMYLQVSTQWVLSGFILRWFTGSCPLTHLFNTIQVNLFIVVVIFFYYMIMYVVVPT